MSIFEIQMKQVFYLWGCSGENKRSGGDQLIPAQLCECSMARGSGLRGALEWGMTGKNDGGKAQRGPWEEDPTPIKLIINNGQILWLQRRSRGNIVDDSELTEF